MDIFKVSSGMYCGSQGGEEGSVEGFDGEIGGKETTWETQA